MKGKYISDIRWKRRRSKRTQQTRTRGREEDECRKERRSKEKSGRG